MSFKPLWLNTSEHPGGRMVGRETGETRQQSGSGKRERPREGNPVKTGGVGAAEGKREPLEHASPLTGSLRAVPGSRAEARRMAGHVRAGSASLGSTCRELEGPAGGARGQARS